MNFIVCISIFLCFIDLGLGRIGPADNINVYDLELSLLSNAVSQISDKNDLKDYSATYVKTKVGAVKIYRPKIFRSIRDSLSITDQNFIVNLLPERLICVNPDSKSGQRFWISSDGLIVLKTLKHYEAKNLQAILDQYANHVMTSENSAIASVLGLYRVKLPGHLFSKYYLVSRNAFPMLGSKDSYIHSKYDLKGSSVGRIASSKSSVKKDVDLTRSGRLLYLGESKPLFLKTLENDLLFLQRETFMDYSLLVSVEECSTKHLRRFPVTKRNHKFGSAAPEDKYVYI